MAPTLFTAIASFLIKAAIPLGSTYFVHGVFGRRLSANLRAWLIVASFAALPFLALSTIAPSSGAVLSAAVLIGSHLGSWAALRRLHPSEDEGWLCGARIGPTETRASASRDLYSGSFSSGVFSHAISVPESEPSWDRERKDAVMLHEGSHLLRHDAAIMFISRILASFAWCIPCATLLLFRLSYDREEACDDLVVRHGADPIEFAQLMLDLAAAPGPHPPRCAPGIGRGKDIQRRINMILEHASNRKRPYRGAITAATISFFVFAISSAIVPSVFADDLPNKEATASMPGSVELSSCAEDNVVTKMEFDLSSLPWPAPSATESGRSRLDSAMASILSPAHLWCTRVSISQTLGAATRSIRRCPGSSRSLDLMRRTAIMSSSRMARYRLSTLI